LVARTNSYPSKGAPLPEGEDSMRPGFGAGTESRSTQGSSASKYVDTAAIRNYVDNMNQRKRPLTVAFLETATDKQVPQVHVQTERKHSDAQPAYKASATVSSVDDESGTTATQKTADNRSACEQPANAAALDAPGEPHELSNDGNCHLSFLERDAIRFLASRGITTAKSLLETNSKELAHVLMEARQGSTTFSSSYSSSYQHVYRWKRIVRQRQAADCDHVSLNMLPPADQKLLTSVGITTADAFLNMKPTTLAHALIESRQQLNMKPWAFSTARQVIYRWIAVVRPKESIPIPAKELLAEEPEERPVGLDPIFKNLSPSDQWFLVGQSIRTAYDLKKVETKKLARHLAQWKREKTRRDFKMSSASIYIGRWKGLVRGHAEVKETPAAASLKADDTTTSTRTGSSQQGTQTVGKMKGTEFPGTGHKQRTDIDCVSDNTDESLGTTNASAKSIHATIDTQAPTDPVENGKSELRTNDKVGKRTFPWVQHPPGRTAATGVDEGEDSGIYYSHDDGSVQDVNSLAGSGHAECGDSLADRKRKRPRTENAPNDFKSGTGISSIAPFVTNMKTFSYW
jgi:hypothetical protein